MKKIIYTFFAVCLMNIAFADIDFTEAINNSTMPTDAEIMQTISKFNFDQEQKEALFKETKKKLKEIYSGVNMSKTNAELNQFYNQINNEEVGQFIDNSAKQQLRSDVSKFPKTTSIPKTQEKDSE